MLFNSFYVARYSLFTGTSVYTMRRLLLLLWIPINLRTFSKRTFKYNWHLVKITWKYIVVLKDCTIWNSQDVSRLGEKTSDTSRMKSKDFRARREFRMLDDEKVGCSYLWRTTQCFLASSPSDCSREFYWPPRLSRLSLWQRRCRLYLVIKLADRKSRWKPLRAWHAKTNFSNVFERSFRAPRWFILITFLNFFRPFGASFTGFYPVINTARGVIFAHWFQSAESTI